MPLSMRLQASIRSPFGRITESIPSRLTPRSRKGMTVKDGTAAPAARPMEATEPLYFICLSTLASISPPAASMAAAQRSDSSGLLPASANSERSMIVAAPRRLR